MIIHPSDLRESSRPRRSIDRILSGLDRSVTRGRLASVLCERKLWGPLQHGPLLDPPERPMLALSFDCDYQEDTDALDRLRRCLTDAGVRASIAAIGMLVSQDPEPYRRLVADGHEIVNHSMTHPDNPILNPDQEFWHLSGEQMYAEIAGAQDCFEEHLGVRPTGFRSPHFKDAHRMLEAAERVEELRYLSTVLATTSPTGVPYRPATETVIGDESFRVSAADGSNSRLVQVPLSPCPQHRWSPFCSYHAIRRPRNDARGQGMHDLDDFTTGWRDLLRRGEPDQFVSVYFDPKDVAVDPVADRFTEMLRDASAEGWHVTTLHEVATTWPGLR